MKEEFNNKTNSNRRAFIKTSAIAGAGLALLLFFYIFEENLIKHVRNTSKEYIKKH